MKRPPYIRPDLRVLAIADLRELCGLLGFVTSGATEVAIGHVRIALWPMTWADYTTAERVDMLRAEILERKAIGIVIDVEIVPRPTTGYRG